ncbi:MAG TPA: branched-chain amino acid ABC transporter substrate-binding protein [Mycobacteriales bacterium]
MRRAFPRGLVAAAAASALVLSACGNSDDNGGGGDSGGSQPASVKLGFMGDLTGENSGIVIPPKNGAQMAIDEYNATNPATKIELKTYDSQGVPEQATALAQQALNTDKIVGLIGPAFSGESQQVGPILEEGEIPSISASATNATLAEKGWKYWHRILPGDRIQGTGIGEFISRAFTAKKVFVIHDNQDYSKGIADFVTAALKDKGVTVETDVIDPKASDYSSTVNKVKPANADAIFYGGYYAQAGPLLKQLREAGVKTRFLSGDGSLDAGLAKGAGGTNADGAVVGCPCLVDPTGVSNEASKKFSEAYKAKYKTAPAIYSAEGYDAASAFIAAIKAGKTTPKDINTFLSTLDQPGVTKQIKFGPNGEPAGGDVFVYLFKGPNYTLLGNSKDAKVG